MKRIFDPIHHFIELIAGRGAPARVAGHAAPAAPAAARSRVSGVSVGRALALYPRARRARDRARAPSTRSRVTDADFFADDAGVAYQRRLLRAALLLHDVGHGPFSHACEAVLGVRHEARSEEILALPEICAGRWTRSRSTRTTCSASSSATRKRAIPPARARERAEPRRRPHGLLAARRLLHRRCNGRYDVEQLLASLRLIERDGRHRTGHRRGAASSRSNRSCWRAT